MRRKVAEKTNGKAKRSALDAVSKRFAAFRPAREVLKVVRAVPTIFCQFDHATGVGGLPVERFMLLHGPSNEGKSLFSLGLAASFLARKHPVLWIDAERTTPITWARQVMGAHADSGQFFASRPESYEQTIQLVRDWLHALAEARNKGELPADTAGLIIVDSIRKLVPKNILDRIMKSAEAEAKRGKAKDIGGRAGQIKAAMNAQWMDETVPLLEHAGAGMVVIAREMQDPDADQWARQGGYDYKVAGGSAIFYDASLAMRVERAAYVSEKPKDEERERAKVYGERHLVTIRKTKVAGRTEKVTRSYFHSSNGVLVSAGFDRARDVLELAERFKVVEVSKSGWISWGRNRWQGRHAAVRRLSVADGGALLGQLEVQVRALFEQRAALEHDPVTGEVA